MRIANCFWQGKVQFGGIKFTCSKVQRWTRDNFRAQQDDVLSGRCNYTSTLTRNWRQYAGSLERLAILPSASHVTLSVQFRELFGFVQRRSWRHTPRRYHFLSSPGYGNFVSRFATDWTVDNVYYDNKIVPRSSSMSCGRIGSHGLDTLHTVCTCM